MNFWDSRYSESGFAYGTEPNAFLRSMADRIPRGRVLSLADGEGRNSVYLAGLGHEVVAVDSSRVGMAKAARLAAERGVRVETVVADLADFVIEPASWEGIVSIFCHLPQPLRARVHADAVRGLRPGGVFLLEAYTPKQLEYRTGGPPVLELLVTLEALREELRGLDLVHAVETEREVREGRLHHGPAAVVQVAGFRRSPRPD
jgi:SAM-dependent methyltransferase